MTLRALHVYSGNLYGGVERMLTTFAGLRGVSGLEQRFALCFDGRLADEIRAAGAPLALLGDVRMSRPWTVLRARRALRRTLRDARPDVVICHSSWTQGLFGGVVRDAGVPLVFWLHDFVTGETWADRLARRTAPDAAICTSAFAGESLGRLWSHVRGDVVYPPVPQPDTPVDRAALRAALRTPADDVVILQASRMEPWKGHRLLVRGLAAIRDLEGWTCWIAGGAQRPHEEAHRAEVAALARKLGVASRIRYLGHRGDVPALMAAADVLCQPNVGPEPFGIAFVEGMHAGLPVVATAIGGAREIVDASCGILVPPDDPAALGDALRQLVRDADLRARLGAAGPAHARALSDPARQAERMRDVLARVVRSARGSTTQSP
ncbi:glycosyltransferase family 4 protein [Longimicrobium sp.]|uniref:glycosyltransferase family 4 protein n=1 Tax=Longimicrobium sp. TaxID=2029185 RepID=UPI002E2FC018|nr:glycosyltransferase family 4 protein [Longimicrobium sp.]HEX6042590.1 glycosyltransferase family 4 protein [Longimicrobium sp.]